MEWLISFVDKLFIWVPRCQLVRSTHGGVKWRIKWWEIFAGKEPEIVELKPGLHWYWPLTSELLLAVTARQPVDIAPMSLLTLEGESVVLSASVIFRVNDVEKAIGEKNWDVDAAVVDITQAVVFEYVRSHTFEHLLNAHQTILHELTESAKAELRRFGVLVERVLLKDFDKSKTYRMLGGTATFLGVSDED